jgi:hypothetical protein
MWHVGETKQGIQKYVYICYYINLSFQLLSNKLVIHLSKEHHHDLVCTHNI